MGGAELRLPYLAGTLGLPLKKAVPVNFAYPSGGAANTPFDAQDSKPYAVPLCNDGAGPRSRSGRLRGCKWAETTFTCSTDAGGFCVVVGARTGDDF